LFGEIVLAAILYLKGAAMSLRSDAKKVWGPTPLNDSRIMDLSRAGLPISLPAADLPSLQLKLQIAGYAQAADPSDDTSDTEYYVVADLGTNKSEVSPGAQVGNDDENVGFYTHSVDVQMWFDGSAYAVDQDTPDASAASGSGSSSSGQSETIGFFGSQLTGTVSSSTTQGGSRTYEDYEVQNLTTHKSDVGSGSEVMKHHLALALCDAGPYVTPFSLIGSDKYLAGLPPRATSNLTLTSAASFLVSEQAKQVPAPATLHLSIKQWMARVVWLKPFTPPPKVGTPQLVVQGNAGTSTVTVDEYDLTKGSGVLQMTTGAYAVIPLPFESDWSFNVDFANGKVTKL
jgi:hypothetical protein